VFITLAFVFSVATMPAQADEHNLLIQDLNCNVIDASEEEAVDLEDPLCAETVDEFDVPYPNADYYVEYFAFGCRYLTADMDEDGDGLSSGTIEVLSAHGLPQNRARGRPPIG
jgi:hypothetical protein